MDPGLQPLVDQALRDLASRLDVAIDAITVQSAELTTWSDRGFLGRDGLRQVQVPVDGSEIVLDHGGRRYRYRTGGDVYTPTLYEI